MEHDVRYRRRLYMKIDSRCIWLIQWAGTIKRRDACTLLCAFVNVNKNEFEIVIMQQQKKREMKGNGRRNDAYAKSETATLPIHPIMQNLYPLKCVHNKSFTKPQKCNVYRIIAIPGSTMSCEMGYSYMLGLQLPH